MVERQLPKLNVAGSNPVSRSKAKSSKSRYSCGFRGFYFFFLSHGKTRKNPQKSEKMQVKMQVKKQGYRIIISKMKRKAKRNLPENQSGGSLFVSVSLEQLPHSSNNYDILSNITAS